MKIVIDYRPIYLRNNLQPIVEWRKSGPIIFNNYKLRKYFNHNINDLMKESVYDLLELLDEIKD